MTRVFYADVSVLSDDAVFEAALKKLPQQEALRVQRLKFRDDKNLSLGARVLLREALRGFPGYAGNEITEKTKNGKPYFKNNNNVFFSISHSGNIALCAVSDKSVGADVQLVCNFKEGVCQRYFSKNEADFVSEAKSEPEKKERFFRIWTLKEAYSKMTGEGLGEFGKFNLDLRNGVTSITGPGISSPACFAEFAVGDYKIAICTGKREEEFDFKKINLLNCL